MSFDLVAISAQIAVIDAKIAKYQTAKEALQSVKRTVASDKTSFKSSYNDFARNSDVKKPDVFEGEMVNELAVRVVTFKTYTNVAVSKAEGIETAITSLISAIESRIKSLQEERKLTKDHLENARIANAGG